MSNTVNTETEPKFAQETIDILSLANMINKGEPIDVRSIMVAISSKYINDKDAIEYMSQEILAIKTVLARIYAGTGIEEDEIIARDCCSLYKEYPPESCISLCVVNGLAICDRMTGKVCLVVSVPFIWHDELYRVVIDSDIATATILLYIGIH